MALQSTNTHDYASRVQAATNIFAEYGDFIRAVICHHIGNKVHADDLFQEFFLSLVCKPLPADIQDVKSYLYKAIANDIVDAVRRVQKYRNYMQKYAKQINYFINKTTPEDASINTEGVNRMFELIEQLLPQREAQAVTMRYKHNCSIERIADTMQVNTDSVRRYICVGLRKIRDRLIVK